MGRSAGITVALVAGLVVGGGAALALQGDSPPATPATTTTAAAEPVTVEAPWVEGGARFRSTVLLPQSFVVGEGRAVLEFSLQSLHWSLGLDESDLLHEELAVQPDSWRLTTAEGVEFTASTEAGDSVVRFEIPEGLEADDVAEVAVTGWRMAVPVSDQATVALESGASAAFADGATVEVITVLEQTNSTIVRLRSRLPDDAWGHGGDVAQVAVPDPGWRTVFSFGGSSNLQLTWEGPDAPTDVVLQQAYPVWQPLAATTVVIGGPSG